ncbi:hypothetical protein BVX93_01640 [bacterium B13(2017)]|nr:hypothetical protein BVX93_01640 [bacterium B13(2017)]
MKKNIFIICILLIFNNFISCKYKEDFLLSKDYKCISLKATKQIKPYDCGLACLASIIKYWGEEIDLPSLIRLFPPKWSNEAYTIDELKSIADLYQFKSFIMKADYPFIIEQITLGRPIICLIDKKSSFIKGIKLKFQNNDINNNNLNEHIGHYVVVIGYSRQNLVVMDPALGIITISKNNFLKQWKNNILLLISK